MTQPTDTSSPSRELALIMGPPAEGPTEHVELPRLQLVLESEQFGDIDIGLYIAPTLAALIAFTGDFRDTDLEHGIEFGNACRQEQMRRNDELAAQRAAHRIAQRVAQKERRRKANARARATRAAKRKNK